MKPAHASTYIFFEKTKAEKIIAFVKKTGLSAPFKALAGFLNIPENVLKTALKNKAQFISLSHSLTMRLIIPKKPTPVRFLFKGFNNNLG